MNCMHDRNKETFWVVLRKQKSRAKAHAIMQSKSRGFPSSQTGISSRTRTNPETNTFKLQNKAAEFPYPESCGEYSTRQMFTKAYCIKQELYSLVFGNICVFGITLLPFPLQILYSLLFLFVSALLPGLMHMYSALHSFQCKICGQH